LFVINFKKISITKMPLDLKVCWATFEAASVCPYVRNVFFLCEGFQYNSMPETKKLSSGLF